MAEGADRPPVRIQVGEGATVGKIAVFGAVGALSAIASALPAAISATTAAPKVIGSTRTARFHHG